MSSNSIFPPCFITHNCHTLIPISVPFSQQSQEEASRWTFNNQPPSDFNKRLWLSVDWKNMHSQQIQNTGSHRLFVLEGGGGRGCLQSSSFQHRNIKLYNMAEITTSGATQMNETNLEGHYNGGGGKAENKLIQIKQKQIHSRGTIQVL